MKEPDAVVVSWVADAVRRAESQLSGASDLGPDAPINLLAGIVNVPDPDAGDHHDLYFSMDDGNATES